MPKIRFISCLLGFLLFSSGVAFAAAPFRLFEIPVTRFTRLEEGRARLDYALLDARGAVRTVEFFNVATPPRTAENAYGVWLVSSEHWFAYQGLGAQPPANFERLNQGLPVTVADIPHYVIGTNAHARLDVGSMANLSTRGVVSATGDGSLIGGFVIHDHPRRALIRAIGPGLAAFGVTAPLADPHLSVRLRSTVIHFNGNWSEHPDAGAIAQTASQLGAFPLAPNSRDAALLVELPPGEYTASVVSESTPASGGTALLEIYVLP